MIQASFTDIKSQISFANLQVKLTEQKMKEIGGIV